MPSSQTFGNLLLLAGLGPSIYALARYQGRRPRQPLVPPLPAEAAFLAAGPRRALAAAFLHLAATGALQQKDGHWIGVLDEMEADTLPPLSHYVYRYLAKPDASVVDLLRDDMPRQDLTRLVHDPLIQKRFWPTEADRARLTAVRQTSILGLAVMLLGVVLAMVWEVELSGGIWLATLLATAVNVVWMVYAESLADMMPAGRRWLKVNRQLYGERLSSERARQQARDDSLQMGFAFLGPKALEDTSLAYLAPVLADSAPGNER